MNHGKCREEAKIFDRIRRVLNLYMPTKIITRPNKPMFITARDLDRLADLRRNQYNSAIWLGVVSH